jgi:hypothetical protein
MLRFALVLAVSALSVGCAKRRTVELEVVHAEVVDEPALPADEVVPITYEDLDLPMEPDTLFQEWMLTQRVRDLDGRRVRITGFMFAGGLFTTRNIKEFILLREKECPYGPGGQAHHVIAVELANELTTSYTTNPVTVEGRLAVRPFTGPDGKTWAMYHINATHIEH